MQRRITIDLTLFLFLASSATAQDWSNLGGDGARNGRSITVGPTSASLLWQNATDFSVIAWQPVVLGDRVFTIREGGFPQNGGAANDALVAYDVASGMEQWRKTLPFNGNTSQQWIAWIGGAHDGRVFACRSEATKPNPVLAYDAASGALLWTSTATTEQFAYDGVVFAPDNGDPIIGDATHVLRLDAASGATVWNVPRVRSVSGNCGAAVVASGFFIDSGFFGGPHYVEKHDLASGALMYTSSPMPGTSEQNQPFVSPDGSTVYFSRTQNNPSVDFLYAFHDTGGALVEIWHRPVHWTTSHEHGIASDGSVYTFLADGEFVRLDPATGNVSATAGVLSPLVGASGNLSPKTAVDANGTVYVSNGWADSPATNGRIWAFSADLSVNHFTLTLNNQNQGGPALGRDGTLLVADRTSVRAYRAPSSTVVSFCAGDGSMAVCPCANFGAAGHGCDNSFATGGARLSSVGLSSLSADSLVLTSTNELPNATSILLQGDVDLATPAPFGDGLRCVGGMLLRLFTRTAQSGVVVVPSSGLSSVSARSAALGDPIIAGESRGYQVYYRDPDLAFCAAPTGNTWNVSQALRATWTP
jgi:outer membrane protein assembly factor BamB